MVSTEKVRADLLAMKDDKFAEFTRKLIPPAIQQTASTAAINTISFLFMFFSRT